MSKLFRKTFILILAVFVFMLTGCSDNETQNNLMPEEKPSDFYFVLNYGVVPTNQIDTLKGTFTKDMVTIAPVTTTLILSDEEINEIYTQMRKINILSYPNNFKPESNMFVTPFETYSIKIFFNGIEKSIYWEDENLSKSKKAVELRNLFKRIEEIIYAKDEYKNLPRAQGGYD